MSDEKRTANVRLQRLPAPALFIRPIAKTKDIETSATTKNETQRQVDTQIPSRHNGSGSVDTTIHKHVLPDTSISPNDKPREQSSAASAGVADIPALRQAQAFRHDIKLAPANLRARPEPTSSQNVFQARQHFASTSQSSPNTDVIDLKNTLDEVERKGQALLQGFSHSRNPSSTYAQSTPSNLHAKSKGHTRDRSGSKNVKDPPDKHNFDSRHIFGVAHAAALEQLRTSQRDLAAAWDRAAASDRNEGGPSATSDTAPMNSRSSTHHRRQSSAGLSAHDPSPTRKSRYEANTPTNKSSAGDYDNNDIHDDNEDNDRDAQAANDKRHENQEYFVTIRKGVNDVMSKLGVVAAAMKQVELESRDIWSDKDSLLDDEDDEDDESVEPDHQVRNGGGRESQSDNLSRSRSASTAHSTILSDSASSQLAA